MREAYGTRARDTDWMDGFYPYHEMNAYLGLHWALPRGDRRGGPSVRDRWANFWVLLAAIGGILMLGKFTFLFDYAHRDPGAGQLARAGAVPSLGLAGGGRAGGGRRRAAGPARRGPAADRRDPGPGPGRRLDPDPALRLRPGLDAAEAVDISRITSPGTDGWVGEFIGAAIRDADPARAGVRVRCGGPPGAASPSPQASPRLVASDRSS